MTNTIYSCSECGLAVIVIGELHIRACQHVDATVVADVSATVHAHARMFADEPEEDDNGIR